MIQLYDLCKFIYEYKIGYISKAVNNKFFRATIN